jgi:hypothetical protein
VKLSAEGLLPTTLAFPMTGPVKRAALVFRERWEGPLSLDMGFEKPERLVEGA